MVLGKRLLFSIGYGAEIQPLEKGRKCPVFSKWDISGFYNVKYLPSSSTVNALDNDVTLLFGTLYWTRSLNCSITEDAGNAFIIY